MAVAGDLNTGEINPSTDSWTATSTTNAPEGAETSHGRLAGSENGYLGRK